jgi:hypothetical protein
MIECPVLLLTPQAIEMSILRSPPFDSDSDSDSDSDRAGKTSLASRSPGLPIKGAMMEFGLSKG